jgi:catechol 2,3-dioxygenase-like lactoylglutathione lyase family enzyme
MAAAPRLTLRTLVLDCHDAHEMARFYSLLLGWQITYDEPDWVLMRNPDGGTGLSFQAEEAYVRPVWPEKPGEQQKMLHLDILVEDLDAAVAHALAAGGIMAAYQPREDLRVILDPAGHPFCLFTG